MAAQKERDYHYFGSTAFNWAKGQTRAEVLEKLGRMAMANLVKEQVKAHRGLYAWTCRVEAPQSQPYSINEYRPVDMATSKSQAFRIQNIKGHALPDDGDQTA
jgi:hypothetical protein